MKLLEVARVNPHTLNLDTLVNDPRNQYGRIVLNNFIARQGVLQQTFTILAELVHDDKSATFPLTYELDDKVVPDFDFHTGDISIKLKYSLTPDSENHALKILADTFDEDTADDLGFLVFRAKDLFVNYSGTMNLDSSAVKMHFE